MSRSSGRFNSTLSTSLLIATLVIASPYSLARRLTDPRLRLEEQNGAAITDQARTFEGVEVLVLYAGSRAGAGECLRDSGGVVQGIPRVKRRGAEAEDDGSRS